MTSVPPEAAARAATLRERIEDANREYYVFDNPSLSDREYDQLFRELRALEEQYPALRTPDSPTQRVGAEPATQLAKHTHLVPMLSLGNAFDEGELEDWEKRIVRLGGDSVRVSGYTAELKIALIPPHSPRPPARQEVTIHERMVPFAADEPAYLRGHSVPQ